MSESSNSTLLLNCVYALTNKTPWDFPHPLYNAGFYLEYVDIPILLASGKNVKPDAQIKNDSEYLLFVECKDGYCDEEQLDRYSQLSVDDVKRNHITSLQGQNLSFDISYFCTAEKKDKLVESLSRKNCTYPTIILEQNRIIMLSGNTFKSQKLNNVFQSINFTTPVPRSFIPFTIDDSNSTVTKALAQYLLTKSAQTFTLDTLIVDMFSNILGYLPQEGKQALKARIGALLAKFKKGQGYGLIAFENGNIKVDIANNVRKFKNACENFIKELEAEESNVKQKKLGAWPRV